MQSRRQSWIEQLLNTAIGFTISLAVWEWVVKPIWNVHTSFTENLSITCLFTVVSVIRGYTLRRIFNRLNKNNNKRASHDTIDRDNRSCP